MSLSWEKTLDLMAASLAPQLAGLDYQDLQALAGVGAVREGWQQKGIDDAMARYQYAQTEPRQRLQDYMGLINAATWPCRAFAHLIRTCSACRNARTTSTGPF